jgi:hypothetical protein
VAQHHAPESTANQWDAGNTRGDFGVERALFDGLELDAAEGETVASP